MSRRETEEKKKRFLECYNKSRINVTVAAAAAGVHRVSIYTWAKEDANFRRELGVIEENFNDYVEDKVRARIERDDWQAIKYYLENKTRHRGWMGDRTEHGGSVKLEVTRRVIDDKPGSKPVPSSLNPAESCILSQI